MRKWMKQLNNQGSTLLTVIICIAFIAILGSMMLTVTMANLQMKIVESKSKKNFYSCEVAMEEIRIGVQEAVSESVRNIYENKVLTNFAAFSNFATEEDRNREIQKLVVADIIRKLCDVDPTLDDEVIVTDTSGFTVKNTYLGGLISDTMGNTTVNTPMILVETKPVTNYYLLRMKDLTIQYLDGEYQTKLSSDIVIHMPIFSFTDVASTLLETYKVEQPYKQFALIADDSIRVQNTFGVSSDTMIQGNVYAGSNGITIDGNNIDGYQVDISGDQVNIITRGTILVKDMGKLSIGPGSGSKLPLIWANNLLTETSATYPSGSFANTELTINGISLIKDDLTLEGRNSRVTLYGAYIGYTDTRSAKGSSMIINGAGSGLDLSGLSRLILAGRAHVSVGNTPGEKDILTGESIAIKSNQRAYLIPGEFIKDSSLNPINHNPLTQEEYTFYGSPVIDIDDSTYNAYLDNPKFLTASRLTGGTVLQYYYFNFGSGRQADAYMKWFYDTKSDALNFMAPFYLSEIKLPDPSAISVVGNMTKYNSTEQVVLVPGMSANTTTYPDDLTLKEAIANMPLNDVIFTEDTLRDKKVGVLSSLYSRMTHNLYLNNYKAYQESDEVVKTGINAGGISGIIGTMAGPNPLELSEVNRNNPNFKFETHEAAEGDQTITNFDSNKEHMYIIDGNVTISAGSRFKGILYASGNIKVESGAMIKGMLVSTGEGKTITLDSGATVDGRLIARGSILIKSGSVITATAETDTYLDGIFEAEGNILRYLYNSATVTVRYDITNPASSYVNLSDLIVYENWRRIE